MDNEGLESWKKSYIIDQFYSKVLNTFRTNDDKDGNYPQYQIIEGLIYFENWNGNLWLCVLDSLHIEVMSEVHNILTESAHGGHTKTYNHIASTYYWPKISWDINKSVSTCDICQKAKPRRHTPVRLLQPIPTPSQPFKVVFMDFIPELPLSSRFNNILVIVDKLTKYAIFIPTTISVTEVKTAKLFFHHIISKFGILQQLITDRYARWKEEFWKEICKRMGMVRSLTMAYHPQADGQTKVLNKSLEISLHAYVCQSE